MRSLSVILVVVVVVLGQEAINDAQKITFEDGEALTRADITPVSTSECGWSNTGGSSFRVILKGVAEYGEFPWMVAIIKKSSTTQDTQWSQTDYLGGGSIISPTVVLTVARWIKHLAPNEIKCRAGEWDKTTDDESYPFQERDVKKIVTHSDYFRESLLNDIGLLFLEKQFDFISAPQIGIACIGKGLPPPGMLCYGMGWGSGRSNKTQSNILKKLDVKLINNEDCVTSLQKTRLGPRFQLHETFTCGISDDDNCKGDGGAPLVCPIDSGRYTIIGMSDYRINETGAPCVYVNVPRYYDWIGQRISEEGVNTNSYVYKIPDA